MPVPSDARFRVLALDPSTDITGVAWVEFVNLSQYRIIEVWVFDAGKAVKGIDKDARFARMAYTRGRLSDVLSVVPFYADLVAYESDTGRGFAATDALKQAVGCYLTVPEFADVTKVAVSRQAACTAAGCLSVYRQAAGKTSRERVAKRDRLKAAVVAWADRAFAEFAYWDGRTCDREAVADALAIAFAAYVTETQRRREASQLALLGKGSRRIAATGKAGK